MSTINYFILQRKELPSIAAVEIDYKVSVKPFVVGSIITCLVQG